ncbi:hypothetical protein [Thermococcus aggregans]|nr:hypothetical protein [Thermococcus aggregans]
MDEIEKEDEEFRKKFKLTWRGALGELRSKYSSVELQHKALEWLD